MREAPEEGPDVEAVRGSPVAVLVTALGIGPDRLRGCAHAGEQTKPRPPAPKSVRLHTGEAGELQTQRHLRLIFAVFSLFSVNHY